MKYFVAAAGLITIHIVILTQLRFEVWPEMLVMPYLQKNGFELYRDMIVPWTPGLMWILQGWFWLAGLTVGNLKLLTWLIIAGTDILVYLIAAKRWGKTAGIISLISFLLLQPLFDGNGLWFDLAVVPLLLLAFHFDNPLFLGPAFLVKQSVVWLIPVFVNKRKDLILTLAGLVAMTGLSFLWFWSRGTLGDYWNWAYDFAFLKLPGMPGHRDLGNWRMWVMALAPFVLVGGIRGITRLRQKTTAWQGEDPFWWAVLSIPFALPRLGLFHFQPAVAFAALALGRSVAGLQRGKPAIAFFLTGPDFSSEKSVGTPEPRSRALATHGRRPWEQVSVLLGLVIFLSFSWTRLLRSNWQKLDRFLEPEVYQLAAKVALETDKNQPVLLVNGQELAYVLSGRLPPKPWLTQFPWFLELPGFQEKLIDQFRQQNLNQVFITQYQNEGEFIPGSYQPKILLEYVASVIPSEAEEFR